MEQKELQALCTRQEPGFPGPGQQSRNKGQEDHQTRLQRPQTRDLRPPNHKITTPASATGPATL